MNSDESNLFAIPRPFDDLEIITEDEIKLYYSKGLLYRVSPFFAALLTNGFSESQANSIKLSCKAEILIIILRCIDKIYNGEDYLNEEILSKIDSKEKLFDLLAACDVYQLDFIKKNIDQYFSSETKLIPLMSTELITSVHLFKLTYMSTIIGKMFDTDMKYFDLLNFETMTIETIDFFKTWLSVIEFLERWISKHEMTNEQCKNMNYIWSKLPKELIPRLIRIVHKCDSAPDFQLSVFKQISHVIYPN